MNHGPFRLWTRKGALVFLGSWFHPKDVSALLEYKNAIVKLFEPRTIHKEKVDSLFKELTAAISHYRWDTYSAR